MDWESFSETIIGRIFGRDRRTGDSASLFLGGSRGACRAIIANGGKSIEDPTGLREAGGAKLYLAYLRDPYGNKICALHRG
jgi:hypothetical protein